MKDSHQASSPGHLAEHDQRHDNRFVRECQSGNATAWEDLFARHRLNVYRQCFRFTRRDCEAHDLTQEVFLRVFCTLGSFRPEEQSFIHWLSIVTRNLLIDNYRRTRHHRRVRPMEEWHKARMLPGAGDRPDGTFLRKETSKVLYAALLRLKPDQREAIELFDVRGLRYREIASRQGVRIGTVKSRLRRGRAALAGLLRVYEPARCF
jgi:RNA polymerase sigma-70 factor (ECF subfamily)